MELLIDNRDERFLCEQALVEDIRKALQAGLTEEGHSQAVEISLSFVDAEEIQRLNRQHRHVDQVTDVLSFPLEETDESWPEELPRPLGDIVVCMDRVREQAEAFGHSQQREILYLCVHSLFHLLGYDHETEADRREMRRKEDATMERIGVLRT